MNIEEVKRLIYMYNKVIELAKEIKEDTKSILHAEENKYAKGCIWTEANEIIKILNETLGVDK